MSKMFSRSVKPAFSFVCVEALRSNCYFAQRQFPLSLTPISYRSIPIHLTTIMIDFFCRNLTCHGERCTRLCKHLSNLLAPQETIRAISLGAPNNCVRSAELSNLCHAFRSGNMPHLASFHIEIHSDTGERGIFNLIDAMLSKPLERLRVLDLEGSYIGQQSCRRLGDILATKKFATVEELNLGRNGAGEFGTKFLLKALVNDKGACRNLNILNLKRNDMGRGFRTLPKAVGSEALR